MGEFRGPLRLSEVRNAPLPQRTSAADTNNYEQVVIPFLTGNYQTFWRGNVLPAAGINTRVRPHVFHYKDQTFNLPQLRGGNARTQMGAVQSATLLARWRSIWLRAKSPF